MKHLQVVWSADAVTQEAVGALDAQGLKLSVSREGFGVVSERFDTCDELVGYLIRNGWRPGEVAVCVECGNPAEQLCGVCISGSVDESPAGRRADPAGLQLLEPVE